MQNTDTIVLALGYVPMKMILIHLKTMILTFLILWKYQRHFE